MRASITLARGSRNGIFADYTQRTRVSVYLQGRRANRLGRLGDQLCSQGFILSEARSDGPEQGDSLAATQMLSSATTSKEAMDIAFAAEALESGTLSERLLCAALSDWTLHGTVTLADHLIKHGAIDREFQSQLAQRAEQRLKRLGEDYSARGSLSLSADGATRTALEQLDPSGRVAKLLGISVATSGVTQNDVREHQSRYQLIRRLGQGGLGTVWLARDTELQRFVALKEIRRGHSASNAAQSRFKREAEITGRLEHPGIVPVYQLGEDSSSGRVFYTMRFLGKKTMQDAIVEYHERRESGDDDPMLLRSLLTAFVSVCQAIGHAHSRKVVHRDLKPENVAIDNFGQVIVIDWGLAKILDEGVVEDSFEAAAVSSNAADMERTIAGQVLGSPLYMAPEQASGRIDEIDQCTDVYGLGAILFAILTGYAPHDQSHASSGSRNTRELITAIASGPTPQVQVVNSEVDAALAAICAKAMSKKRYARYQSASQLAEEVQRWMAGEPVMAYQERFSQRLGRWIQHHHRLSQLIGAIATIGLVLAATLTISSHQTRIRARQARFEEFRSDGREIELQLLTVAENTGKDVRFMSSLPPIQGIIDAEAGVQENEGLEVWRGRLERIYEGLLRANPEYLSVAFAKVSDQDSQELVRVERHATEQGFIRRIPVSRLAVVEKSSLLNEVLALEPGDVKLAVGPKLSGDDGNRQARRLVATIPVFDELTGEVFGVVTIESNLAMQINEILGALGAVLGEIYVCDPASRVWVRASPEFGVEMEPSDVDIRTIVPEVAAFFADGAMTRSMSDYQTYLASRVLLDPSDPTCHLGLVMKLAEDR